MNESENTFQLVNLPCPSDSLKLPASNPLRFSLYELRKRAPSFGHTKCRQLPWQFHGTLRPGDPWPELPAPLSCR